MSTQMIALLASATETVMAKHRHESATPGTFGEAVMMGCVSHAFCLLRNGILDVDAIAEAIHVGRGLAAMTYPGQSEDHKTKRIGMCRTEYREILTKEQEKLKVMASAIIEAYKEITAEKDETSVEMRGDPGEYPEIFIDECLRKANRENKPVKATLLGTSISIPPKADGYLMVAKYFTATSLRYAAQTPN